MVRKATRVSDRGNVLVVDAVFCDWTCCDVSAEDREKKTFTWRNRFDVFCPSVCL